MTTSHDHTAGAQHPADADARSVFYFVALLAVVWVVAGVTLGIAGVVYVAFALTALTLSTIVMLATSS